MRHTMSEQVPDQTFREDVTERGKVNEKEMRRPGVDYLTIGHDPALAKKANWAIKRSQELYKKSRGQ